MKCISIFIERIKDIQLKKTEYYMKKNQKEGAPVEGGEANALNGDSVDATKSGVVNRGGQDYRCESRHSNMNDVLSCLRKRTPFAIAIFCVIWVSVFIVIGFPINNINKKPLSEWIGFIDWWATIIILLRVIVASVLLSYLVACVYDIYDFIKNHKMKNEARDLNFAKCVIQHRNEVLGDSMLSLKLGCSNYDKIPDRTQSINNEDPSEGGRAGDGDNLEALLTSDELFNLSVVDIFVEKAQAVLARRAKYLIYGGILTVVFTFILLTIGFIYAIMGDYIHEFFVEKIIVNLKNKPTDISKLLSGYGLLIFLIFKSIAIAAFIYVTVKLLLAFARSFFNEGLSLYERRHALRFGRMYIYLKKGQVNEEWLEKLFQWNKETKTSFLDIKPEVITETLLHKIVGAASDFWRNIKALKDKS